MNRPQPSTEYDYAQAIPPATTVRDGSHDPGATPRHGRPVRIVQFSYNGTGLDPRVQAAAGDAGAFADLPAVLRSRNARC